MKIRIRPLLLFHSALMACGGVAAQEPAWLACRTEAPEKQLECYQHATKLYLDNHPPADTTTAVSTDTETAGTASRATWRLDRLWPLPNELPSLPRLADTFLQHKQNYLLLDASHSPSAAPTSPNPLNQVPAGNAPSSSQMKYQISLKAQMPITWPWGDTLWFAYTQQSHWQAFSSRDSRPFRETDYEPELIFLSHRLEDTTRLFGPLTPRFFNLSYLHQSNGQSLPRSRSWNRLTAQLGSEYRFKATDEDTQEKRLAVLIRPWWRIPENVGVDDNADIGDYLGHGDIEIDFWRGREMHSLLLRNRAIQLDWSFPLSDAANTLNLHLQYFSGYGENLIDYNHKLHSFGIGVSLPY